MDSLNVLANTNCFNILQEKLNEWKYEFEANCPEANISRCCELLELNARIQAQLFKLLGVCGLYGGLKGSEIMLRNQLTPYLGKDYLENGLTSNIVMDILNDISQQTAMLPKESKTSKKSPQKNNCPKDRAATCSPPRWVPDSVTANETNYPQTVNREIFDRLTELENTIIDLSKKPAKKKKKGTTQRPASLSKDVETVKESQNPDIFVQSDTPGDFSGSDVEEIRNDAYLQSLVGRYNDLFSESRIKAMEYLRIYNDDHENNQRILFALIMVTAKCVAKSQRSYKSGNSSKPIQPFNEKISHSWLKNLRTQIIYKLINNREKYFRFHLPDDFSFMNMKDLINRAIQLFWNFGGAKKTLNLLEAADGEMFDEHKYRRSYDSDIQAPLVNHHIWPCLVQNHRVLVKGEACTRASKNMVQGNNGCLANNLCSSRCSSK